MNTNKGWYTNLLAIAISFLWGFSTSYAQAALPSSIPAGLKLYDINAADGCFVVLQQGSKIITVAALGNDTSQMNMAVVRFDGNGQLDPTFGVNGRIRLGSTAVGADIDTIGLDGSLCSGAIQLNNKIILAGFVPSSKRIIVLRLEENGSLDLNFGSNGFYAFPLEEFGFKWSWGVNKVAVDSAQRILVAGGVDIPRTNSQQQGFLIRINATGQLDTTFNDNTGYFVWNNGYSYFSEVVQDNNGNILLGGCGGGCANYTAEAVVLRLTSNGKLDMGFADNGIRYLPLFSDSNPSQSMPGNRSIKLISIDSFGRIVATGTNYYASSVGITYRLDTNGNLDPTYINDYFVPRNVPVSQRVDTTGVLFVGSTYKSYYDTYVGLLKLDNNGVVQPFPTFPPPTILENSDGETLWRMVFDGNFCSEPPGGAIFQPDGKIVVAGNFGCGSPRVYQGIYLVRFNPDSSIDETFGGGGTSTGASAIINRVIPLDGGFNISGASQAVEGTNVVKFGIEVKDDNGATVNYETTPNEDGTFSKVIEGLTNGLRYFVKVFTVDAAQTQGPASAPVSVIPQAAPQDAKEWGSNQLPVLLLHGWRSNGGEWETMRKALVDIGIPASAPTFNTLFNENLCLEAVELEEILARFKNATGRSKIIVIGHSQGGVVARAYMQFGPKPSEFADRFEQYAESLNGFNGQQGTACYEAFADKSAFYNGDIEKLITYGTPHHGVDACPLDLCNAYPLLRPDNNRLLSLLNDFNLFPLPENLSIVNLLGSTSNIADDDCVVSTSSQDMRDQSNGYYVANLEPYRIDWVRHYKELGCKTLFFRTPEKEDIHSIFKHGLGAPEYVVRALSPVDLIVVDPEYRTISKEKREIWGAIYEEQTDDSGHTTDVIRIPFPVSGNYQITAVPDPGAAPTETFSIETELSGVTTRLVENMPIQNIPEQPFAVAVDITPDPFSFVDQTGVALNRVINSNVITVSGINQPAAITILGGEYSVNGAAYTSVSGLVNNGDKVSVRHTSAATYDTATDTVLSIGGYSDVFTSTTMPECVSTPELTVALSPNSLWPPNHNMVTITANVQASDTCDPNPTVTLVSITSNEPDNGLGDGDTPNDIQGAELGTDDRSFALRAERSGTGTGRLYTVTYQAKDRAGKTSTTAAQVVVPHD